jgi:CoA:oxalate CoA-transferase
LRSGYRDLPAYDIIVQAMSGGMSLTGERGGRPVRAGVPIADLSAGLYAVIGILAALRRREAEGRGDALDISMLDCQVAMLTYQAAYVLAGGDRPGPQGRVVFDELEAKFPWLISGNQAK